ncbi:YcnI family copper-binding membrane protein [Streptomyces montanisoli]|uniref:YcnI family protein n=1 Tax=Streptomyces montanisoli TaxID=2798581 RepID=A0A940RUQ7_9ACTN|nr:YcnI family protein [Streptomyces montanisoli]MBP0457476.1 YcnI family protein [Streptomyces montanisoli]
MPSVPAAQAAPTSWRGVKRAAVVGGLAASAVLVLAGTASAHVTVNPEGEAVKGGSAVVDFKVPNERDNATTTKLEVDFPTDTPLASVMPEPVPGWKIDITKSKLSKPVELWGSKVTEAVSKVTWTADKSSGSGSGDSGIPVGEFQLFPVSVATLPKNADQVTFKALQTYSNNEVVRWIEVQKPGAPEPENPAPTLKLTAAPAADSQGSSSGSSSASNASDSSDSSGKSGKDQASSSTSDGSDTLARVLGIVGIVIGAAGVACGVLIGRRRSA